MGVQSQVSFVHTSLLFDCAVGVIARSGGISREPPYLSCLLFDCAVAYGSWRMVVGVLNLLVGGTAL